MQLDNTFRVPLPVEDAWALLTDLERVASCLQSAHLSDVTDGEYRGDLSATIGPITARYTGTARFLERDDVDHRAVLEARGREQRGNGAASATIVTSLQPEGEHTRVRVSTELSISGRAAQFGRSVLAEVAAARVSDFASRVEAAVSSGNHPGLSAPDGTTAAPAAGAETTGGQHSLNVLRTQRVLRRAAVPAACAALAGLLGWLVGRRRGSLDQYFLP